MHAVRERGQEKPCTSIHLPSCPSVLMSLSCVLPPGLSSSHGQLRSRTADHHCHGPACAHAHTYAPARVHPPFRPVTATRLSTIPLSHGQLRSAPHGLLHAELPDCDRHRGAHSVDSFLRRLPLRRALGGSRILLRAITSFVRAPLGFLRCAADYPYVLSCFRLLARKRHYCREVTVYTGVAWGGSANAGITLSQKG